ncbi:MAG: 4-hydroxy-tetrahydrodipicolinate reductase [Candidatus Tectomicrobia bacterium]|nr:4-hydroxy-tetrahydrodipicolinate reductase [Candidatus Tectomicrobia bacterium]
MIRAVVAGAAGRMGRCVVRALKEAEDFELAAAFESPGHASVGSDAGAVAGVGDLGVPVLGGTEKAMEGADVLIDFTAPAAAVDHLGRAASRGLAAVVGTTGFDAAQRDAIARVGREIRAVVAPNMSVGVNVVIRLVKEAARLLGEDFDVELVEAHHHFKKDAPSGTALALAAAAARALGRDLSKVGVYGREGQVGERPREEIGVMSLRAGDIVGEHWVLFGGVGERVEIIHRAHSRDNFARGALRAARWVIRQPAGVYSMADVLGLED